MANEEKPVGTERAAPEPDPTLVVSGFPRERRRRSLKFKHGDVVDAVLNDLDKDERDRQPRIDMRKGRYAKYRGYTDYFGNKDWPWKDSANFWVPLMMTNALRMKAALENALKGVRPMLSPKATKRANKGKEESIANVLDFQFYQENGGEKLIDTLAGNFVEDEAIFGFVHWVKDRQTVRDIRVLPGKLNPDMDYRAQFLQAIDTLFPNVLNAVMKDEDGFVWEVDCLDENNEPLTAIADFYDRDDGRVEVVITQQQTTFNGPAVEILDFEDVVFPVRSGNLQPPGPANPYGAPYVNRLCKASLDSIKRRKVNGTYDLLTDDGIEAIVAGRSATGSGEPSEQPKEQKDKIEGVETSFGQSLMEDRQIVEHYGRYDVDGDGLEEDVIFWVERNSRILLKACLLTEMYPGVPIMRPIIDESIFPVANRVYGISFTELLESFQDITQITMNQHVDWGTLTNMPFFFYRASSGMKAEPIMLEPGMGYPLDDPQRDVAFAQFPQKDQTYTLNTVALVGQMAERIAMLPDTAFGRVPTGKSAALRTVGNMVSLMSQIDVRSEQVLRRLFFFLSGVHTLMHRLNKHFLPDKKEIRVFGYDSEQNVYMDVTPDTVDADVDFEFKATMLNTNKQIVSQSLQESLALIAQPIAMMMGITTPEKIYELMRDIEKSKDHDPDKYLQRPQGTPPGPKLMAEDAIGLIIEGRQPEGSTLEQPAEHKAKLDAFVQSEQFGFLSKNQVPLFHQWYQQVAMQAMQQQAMMMMAQQMQGGQGGQQGPGGAPTTITQPQMGDTPIQPNNPMDQGTNVQ